MALEPLASLDDLQHRLGRHFEGSDAARALSLLRDASAAVRLEAGQQFTLAETTERVIVTDRVLVLSQRPVVAFEEVKDVEGNEVPVTWDGLDRIDFSTPERFDLDSTCAYPLIVDVTYTHGYEEIPDDIIAVVCQIAARAFGQPADKSGITQETAGPFSYTVGAAAAAGTLGMLDDERSVVRRYRRVGGTAWVR